MHYQRHFQCIFYESVHETNKLTINQTDKQINRQTDNGVYRKPYKKEEKKTTIFSPRAFQCFIYLQNQINNNNKIVNFYLRVGDF